MHLVVCYIIIGKLERDLRAGFWDKRELGLFGICGHAVEIDLLKVGSRIASRQKPIALELSANPICGHVAALLAGTATLQGICGKIFHRCPDLLRVNGIHRLLRACRKVRMVLGRNERSKSDEQNYAELFHCSS
jgi:hypothetical protein